MDGDARGGAALSVKAVTGKPIKFIGVGEKADALEPFHPERMASRILGMGDMLSLIEKAQETYDEEKAAKLEKKLRKNEFTLEDFLDQMGEVQKMGGIGKMRDMIPGLGAGKISEDDIAKGEKEFKQMEAIIYSMTPAERAKPSLIDPKRKRRIAAGSGTKVEDVNRLLRQLEQSRKLMKMMSGKGGKKAVGYDIYAHTSEALALETARGYAEFFNDRMGGASGKNYYSACAALCWTDSAQHGRLSYSEYARMSGRVDPCRI